MYVLLEHVSDVIVQMREAFGQKFVRVLLVIASESLIAARDQLLQLRRVQDAVSTRAHVAHQRQQRVIKGLREATGGRGEGVG